MKKTLIFTLMAALLMLPLYSGTGSLTIEKNRFNFHGKTFIPLGCGMNDMPSGALLDRMIESGINQFNIAIAPTRYSGIYRYQPGLTYRENWGGWNQRFFDNLNATARRLEKKNSILVLVIFSTCLRKNVQGESRWNDHLFNQVNGGMFPADQNAVTSFYDMQNSGSIAAQKLLLDKIVDELRGLTNVGIALNWEMFTGYRQSVGWTVHMMKHIRQRWSGPLGIGSHHAEHLEEISAGVGFNIFGIIEASNIWIDMEAGKYTPPQHNPLIMIGYHPRVEAYYSRGKPERKCEIMKPGQEQDNVIASAITMVVAINEIGCASLPFPQYWHHLSSRFKQDCKKFNIEKYDLFLVKKELFAFTLNLSKALKAGCDIDALIPRYQEPEKEPEPAAPEPVVEDQEPPAQQPTEPTQPQPTEPGKDDTGSKRTGKIVIISAIVAILVFLYIKNRVLGILVTLILAALVVFIYIRRKKRKNDQTKKTEIT